MNIVLIHLILVFTLVCCWLEITGRSAEWQWRNSEKSRFRWLSLGIGALFDDLESFKRFRAWLAWIILAVVLFVYVTSMYHWIRG